MLFEVEGVFIRDSSKFDRASRRQILVLVKQIQMRTPKKSYDRRICVLSTWRLKTRISRCSAFRKIVQCSAISFIFHLYLSHQMGFFNTLKIGENRFRESPVPILRTWRSYELSVYFHID